MIILLNNYFCLFDVFCMDVCVMEDLLFLFILDVEIVLNGISRRGFDGFMKVFYEYNMDVKYMWDGWVF